MSKRQTRKRSNRIVRFSYQWHRRIGVLLSLPLVLVALTGLALNHAYTLRLDSVMVATPWILSWYGMEPKSEPQAMRHGSHWAALMDQSLYLNGIHVGDDVGGMTGFSELDSMLVVSGIKKLYLLDTESLNVIDRLGEETLPPGEIVASRVENSRVLLDTTVGTFVSSSDIVSFEKDDRNNLPERKTTALNDEEYELILKAWRGSGLTLSRLLLDIHSGRFLGSLGVFFVDLSAVALLLLVVSGIYNTRRMNLK